MTYEDLVRDAVHSALVGLVERDRAAGVTGVDLSTDGGILKTNGRWAFAVRIEKLEPVRPEATAEVSS